MSSTNMRLSASALYRSIMKAHKKYLPDQMRRLGDAYVKSEFKSHKEVKKPEQLEEFFSAWEQYLSQIQEAARAKESLSAGSLTERAFSAATMSNSVGSFGKDVPHGLELSNEQRSRLNKLKEEALRRS